MKKMFLTFALAIGTLCTINAQSQGDWYVGTGDVSNVAWTEWAISPTIGYGVTDDIMLSASVSQDSASEMNLDVSARYFINGYFLYASASELSLDNLSVGAGRMFTLRKGIYVDPKLVYDLNTETTNLSLGFGLKF
jgi:hypothetical protein